jgi:hypothetical protein
MMGWMDYEAYEAIHGYPILVTHHPIADLAS